MKHVIVLMLCLILQSTVLSVEFAGGTGEPNDPYQIATAEQLIAIGSDRDLMKKSFILVANIDLDPNLPGGRIFEDALIAQDDSNNVTGHTGPSFDGIFDGRGYTITNLHIEGKHGHDAGLFGKFSGLVRDLNLTNVVVNGSPSGAIAGLNHRGMILRCYVAGQVSGDMDVGGLVGSNWDASLVECKTEVKVSGDSDVGGMVGGGPGGMMLRCEVQAEVIGNNNVGGLVGSQRGHSIIECRVNGVVSGVNNVGGLIGDYDDTLILRSSANCVVTAEQNAGGLIGNAFWNNMLIADCYARGSITGSTLGGLIGKASAVRVVNCYAACETFPLEVEGRETLVGGLFGDILSRSRTPLTIGCFWDAELSGITASTGSDQKLELGKGLNTEPMITEDVFLSEGWNFSQVWMISEGEYPIQQWQAED